MTPEQYQAFWNNWMWTAIIAGAVFSVSFWVLGYWVLRLVLVNVLSDAGVLRMR